MSITWTPELSVGVEEIDNQHKDLFKNVDLFFENIKKGKGNEDLSRLFGYLETYVTTHFSMEEKYMTKFSLNGCGYQGEKMHVAQHRAFMRDFSAFREVFLEEGPTPQLVGKFQQWILNWMSSHFGKTDRGLGRFLQTALPFLKRN